jgi:hypothetical protein
VVLSARVGAMVLGRLTAFRNRLFVPGNTYGEQS